MLWIVRLVLVSLSVPAPIAIIIPIDIGVSRWTNGIWSVPWLSWRCKWSRAKLRLGQLFWFSGSRSSTSAASIIEIDISKFGVGGIGFDEMFDC